MKYLAVLALLVAALASVATAQDNFDPNNNNNGGGGGDQNGQGNGNGGDQNGNGQGNGDQNGQGNGNGGDQNGQGNFNGGNGGNGDPNNPNLNGGAGGDPNALQQQQGGQAGQAGQTAAPRPTKRFRQGEEHVFRGPRGCYVRPMCKSERIDAHYKKVHGGPLIICKKPKAAKPSTTEPEFVWVARPGVSELSKKRGYVRFENKKHKTRYLCMTRRYQQWSKEAWKAYFAINAHRTNRGCLWLVKQANVYNRITKQMVVRFIFINRRYKRYMLRYRRNIPGTAHPRPLYGAQNYLAEARVDYYGSFAIEAAGGGGYHT